MRLALVPFFVVVGAATACGGNDNGVITGPGNVVLEITTLYPRNDDAWLARRDPDPTVSGDEGYAGDPGPVTLGCDLRLGVLADVQNFYLRAPDACGGNLQCGFFVVDVDPSSSGPAATGRGASTSVVVDLSALQSAGTLVGPHVLRPSLVQANGVTFTYPYAFTPKDVNVTFATDDSCGAAGSNGEGGAGGAAETSGAADAGGAGNR